MNSFPGSGCPGIWFFGVGISQYCIHTVYLIFYGNYKYSRRHISCSVWNVYLCFKLCFDGLFLKLVCCLQNVYHFWNVLFFSFLSINGQLDLLLFWKRNRQFVLGTKNDMRKLISYLYVEFLIFFFKALFLTKNIDIVWIRNLDS